MKKVFVMLFAFILAVSLSACSGSKKQEVGQGGASQTASPSISPDQAGAKKEKTKVNFGVMPYYDYSPWELAAHKGFFDEEGIEYKSTLFPVEGNVAPALVNGSIDIGGFSDTPSITLAAQFSDLRMIGFQNVFKGFAIMARKDSGIKTYEQLLKELNDPKQAAIEAGKQLKGKKVVTTSGAAFYMVLEQALINAGLTMKDIKLIDMEPDAGVSAFVSGTGDFYLGGLPQREKLSSLGYPAFISGEEIGPGAVILSGLATTKKYAEANPEILVKMQKVWYKTMDFIKNNPDEAYTFIAEWSNKNNGAKNTGEDVKKFLKDYVLFAETPEQAQTMFYDANSPTNWKKRYDSIVKYHEDNNIIKKGSVKVEDIVMAESIFQQLK